MLRAHRVRRSLQQPLAKVIIVHGINRQSFRSLHRSELNNTWQQLQKFNNAKNKKITHTYRCIPTYDPFHPHVTMVHCVSTHIRLSSYPQKRIVSDGNPNSHNLTLWCRASLTACTRPRSICIHMYG